MKFPMQSINVGLIALLSIGIVACKIFGYQTFQGHINHSCSGEPLSGVSIKIYGNKHNAETTTDKNGFFKTRMLVSGDAEGSIKMLIDEKSEIAATNAVNYFIRPINDSTNVVFNFTFSNSLSISDTLYWKDSEYQGSIMNSIVGPFPSSITRTKGVSPNRSLYLFNSTTGEQSKSIVWKINQGASSSIDFKINFCSKNALNVLVPVN
jgi:hypothetical protein